MRADSARRADALLPRDAASDASDFAALYRRQRSLLIWHLRSHGASQAEAADAVQDAFAEALLARDRMRDEAAWPAWLRTVAVRSYQRARAAREAGQAAAVVPVAELAGVADASAASGDAAELRRQEEVILALLAALPPQQRRVFTLHYEGWTTGEIAALLGIRQAAVRQNITRARRSLRNALERRESE